MTEFWDAALLLPILLGSSALGLFVQPLLSEHHRSLETTNLVQLVVIMLVTFAAPVLGLLTTSVKASFDTVAKDLRAFAVELIELDQSLREYGSQADAVRGLLRSYTAAAIATTWTEEPEPPGDYYPKQHPLPFFDVHLERPAPEEMARVELEIRHLQPQDAIHRKLVFDSLSQFEHLMEKRWKLIEESHSSIPMPFYFVLVFWLVIVFASFGLSAPRNALSYMTILLGALSIASVIFAIRELDTPFHGIIVVSSQPMRDALVQLNR